MAELDKSVDEPKGKTAPAESGAIEPELEFISPSSIDFDPDNPRFASAMAGKTQPEIQALLINAPHYASELVQSFLENGFIKYEPLVARRLHGGHFLVVEGNRRLAAVKEILQHPEKYSSKRPLDRIPVLVFPDAPTSETKEHVRVYLGVRHLLGFREWPPLSKAAFLDREARDAESLERLIKETQLTKRNIRRFVVPYRLLKKAKTVIPGGEDFWMLAEALGRSGIAEFIKLEVALDTLAVKSYNRDNFNQLLADLYGPLNRAGQRDADSRIVEDTRDLSRLGKVLLSEKAAKALHSGKNLEAAELLLDSKEQSVRRMAESTKRLAPVVAKAAAGTSRDAIAVRKAFADFKVAVETLASIGGKADA